MVLQSPTRGRESPRAPSARLRRFAEDSVNESSGGDDASSPWSPHSPHHYSDKCHHCHGSWAEQCKTEYEDDKENYVDTEKSSEGEGDDQGEDKDDPGEDDGQADDENEDSEGELP